MNAINQLRGLAAHSRPADRPTPVEDEAEPAARRGAGRGQIIVMMAFFLVSLMGMLGLAIDVGYALAAKRAVQGAADAGAMAGARQIARYKTSAPTSAQADANALATANTFGGLTPTMYYCKYIGDNWAEVGSCPSNVPSNATGVRIRTRMEVPTFFIQVVPGVDDSVEVLGYAKARVQKATFADGDGPFVVCGSHSWAVINAAGTSVTLDIPIWSGGKVSPAAVGVTFRVHDPQINQTSGIKKDAGCNAKAANFNGLNDQDANDNKGKNQWFNYIEGTQAGPTRTKVEGAQGCGTNTSAPYNCVMILPIAVNSPPEDAAHQKQVYVVGWAAFYVTNCGSNCHNAKLLDNHVVTGPGQDGWTRDDGGPIVIRLIW
jgi:hypothetical protein